MTDPAFLRRAAAAVGLALLGFGVYLLLWHALDFVLLVFAGALLAVFLNGLAGWAADRRGLSYGVALAAVGALLLASLAGLGWLVGPDLVDQGVQLVERVPSAVEQVRSYLQERPWGRNLLSRVPTSMEGAGATPAGLFGRITGLFSSTLGLLANVAIVVFLAVYLAADPGLYRRGVLHLVRSGRRGRTSEVLDALGGALRRWLVGRFASMAVVALLTAVALLVLGVPLVLGLSVLAGLLSFVPLLGPLASAVPAVLVGFGEGGPGLALQVAVAYAAVQFVESYLVTPLIQKRAVAMPPALLIAAQILMGLAAGVLGVLLATPLAVVVVVLVQTLYVQDVLGDEVTPLGA